VAASIGPAAAASPVVPGRRRTNGTTLKRSSTSRRGAELRTRTRSAYARCFCVKNAAASPCVRDPVAAASCLLPHGHPVNQTNNPMRKAPTKQPRTPRVERDAACPAGVWNRSGPFETWLRSADVDSCVGGYNDVAGPFPGSVDIGGLPHVYEPYCMLL
jgi:hypothetical protein